MSFVSFHFFQIVYSCWENPLRHDWTRNNPGNFFWSWVSIEEGGPCPLQKKKQIHRGFPQQASTGRLVGMVCFWLTSPVEGCACRFPAFTGWLICRFCEVYNSPVKDCAWVFPAFTGWFWRFWRSWTSPSPGSFVPHNCLRRWRSKAQSVGCLFVCRAERRAWLHRPAAKS